MNFFGKQNLNGHTVKNLVLHSGTSFPSTPTLGQLFYRTDQEKAYIYVAAGWREIEGV